MQIKSVRGAIVAVAAGAAVLGAPAAAQAKSIPLVKAPAANTQQGGPVFELYDPQTGSASMSSQVNAFGLCAIQSISANVQCIGGAR
ncbi:hypothetical protein KO481_19920 [Nocardia sp. NEAU-G5]|uniref:Uncharacterized protein n=1 Tax=Nocardia albiluteola TaxID=2842303 RepID=A0ABS6B0X4_9NOCA|nr:hypothetical protein [Nocardia albiluteola]MBU3063788.1 hypothetical protein [Nocardia albiluteola]